MFDLLTSIYHSYNTEFSDSTKPKTFFLLRLYFDQKLLQYNQISSASKISFHYFCNKNLLKVQRVELKLMLDKNEKLDVLREQIFFLSLIFLSGLILS